MKRPELDLTGQVIDGRFRVERLLGSGGMGTVWRAQHVQSLHFVALKTLVVSDGLPEAAIQRCLKEARAAAALKSRHVVRVTDVQSKYLHHDVALPYLIMELLEGSDFESVLRERVALDVAETAWVMRQICRGIQLAHQHGIVHRDLKPANLFLTLDDEGVPVVKICDFGLAKLVHESTESSAHAVSTRTGTIVGTPHYMAPEQLRGAPQTSGAIDQWAIGLITYRLLAGRDYFDGAPSAIALSLRIVHDELPLPSRCSSRVPVEFDAWFLRSCNRDPIRRFPSVEAQAQALLAALGNPVPVPVAPQSLRNAVDLDDSEFRTHDTAAVAPSNDSKPMRLTRRFYLALGLSSAMGVFGTVALAAVLEQLSQRRGASTESIPSNSNGSAASRPLPSAPQRVEDYASATLEPAPSSHSKWSLSGTSVARKRRGYAPVASSIQLALPPSAPVVTNSSKPAVMGLAPASACSRSIECASRLCVAERCR